MFVFVCVLVRAYVCVCVLVYRTECVCLRVKCMHMNMNMCACVCVILLSCLGETQPQGPNCGGQQQIPHEWAPLHPQDGLPLGAFLHLEGEESHFDGGQQLAYLPHCVRAWRKGSGMYLSFTRCLVDCLVPPCLSPYRAVFLVTERRGPVDQRRGLVEVGANEELQNERRHEYVFLLECVRGCLRECALAGNTL